MHFIYQNEIGAIYICLLYLCLLFLYFGKFIPYDFCFCLTGPTCMVNSLPLFHIVIQSGRLISQKLGGYTKWETQDLTRTLQLAGWPEEGSSPSPTSFYSRRDNNRDWRLVFKTTPDSPLEGGPAFCIVSVCPLSGVSLTMILKGFHCKEVGFPFVCFGFNIRMILFSVYHKNSQSAKGYRCYLLLQKKKCCLLRFTHSINEKV